MAKQTMTDIICKGIDYHTVFDPNVYLREYHSEAQKQSWPVTKANLEALHQIYCTGMVKGKRIIDIGCGPTIHSLIPAAKWFDELFLADLSPRNVQAVQQWLQRDPQSFDWQTHFELFASKNGHRDAWRQYEDMLRLKLKEPLLCDFFQFNPLHPADLGLFDAVTTYGALQSGATNNEEYQTVMKNVVSLLKPGGYFIEVVIMGCPFYFIGEEKFWCLPVTKDDVLAAFKQAGVEVVQVIEKQIPVDADFSKCFGSLAVLGRK